MESVIGYWHQVGLTAEDERLTLTPPQPSLRLPALGKRPLVAGPAVELGGDASEAQHQFVRHPSAMVVAIARNMGEVPDLIDLVADLGVDVYAFGRYCPTSGQRSGEFHMEPLEYRALLVECQERIRVQKARGARTYYYPKDHLWRLLEWEQGSFSIPEGADSHAVHDGCHCGTGHLTILPTGAVHACRRMDSPVGDVRVETLADIYFGSRLAEYRRKDLFEKCVGCPLHGWCRGCPAVVFGYTGDRYAPDPQCWYGLV